MLKKLLIATAIFEIQGAILLLFLMPVTLLSFVFSTAIFCLGVIAWMSKDYVDRVHIEPVLKGLILYHLLAGVSFFYMVWEFIL